MALWQNIPFFCILLPLGSAAMTSVLKPKLARRWTLLVLCLLVVLSGALTGIMSRYGQSYTFMMGHFPAPWGNEIRAGLLEALTALMFNIIMILSLMGGLKKVDDHIAHDKQSLYYVMLLLLTAALMAQVYTNDIFTAYVFLEIMTISACALIAARTKGRTLVAATRYMIMNLLGSDLFLLGISILYCLTGHLLMEDIHDEVMRLSATGAYLRPLTLSMALITIGLAVKSALYPFHTWLPDAYASATPSSSAMLASLVSKAYIFLYIKFVIRVFDPAVFRETHIQTVLLVFSAVGIILGSIDAILEKKLRRMLAYSSVAQIGYIYLGIALGTRAGVAAAVFHIIAHALAKAVLFLSGDRLIGASDGDATFHELRGAGYRAPLSGAVFSIAACSIVGIPFLGGFASKLYLADACMGVDMTNALIALIVLAVSTALNAAYFLITVVTLYMKPTHAYHTRLNHPKVSTAALAVFALLIVALGVFAPQVMAVIQTGVSHLL